MKLSVAIPIAILAETQAFAQAPAGATPSASALLGQRRSLAGQRPMSAAPASQSSNVNSLAALHQRIEDTQGTLQSMHALMAQMRAKATKNGTKDPLVKANLEMWNLMVSQLDKQLEELKQTEVAREDMEARRAAMYKQADAKAAQAARANMMNGAQTPATGPALAPAAPAATPSAGAPAPAAQAPAAAAAPGSPATSTASPH